MQNLGNLGGTRERRDFDDHYSLGDCREWVERIFLDSKRLSDIRDMRIEWEEGYCPNVSGHIENHKEIVADAAGMRAADAEKLDILKWHGVEDSWLDADQEKKEPGKGRRTYGDPLCAHAVTSKDTPDRTCKRFAVEFGDMCAYHNAARLKKSERIEKSPGSCCVLINKSAVCKKLAVPGGYTCSSHTKEHADESVRSALEVLRRNSEIDKWYLENPSSEQK